MTVTDSQIEFARQAVEASQQELARLEELRAQNIRFQSNYGAPTTRFALVARRPSFDQFVSYSEDCRLVAVFEDETAAEAYKDIAPKIAGYELLVEEVVSF